MSFSLTPHIFALSQAVELHARAIGQRDLLGRPAFVLKAVARRLRIGVRALEAFLRRILILMALEMEPDLVFVPRLENLARAKGGRKLRVKKPFLQIYTMPDRPFSEDFKHGFDAPNACSGASDLPAPAATLPPNLVPINKWLAQLDYLHAIATDPIAKARRVAFSLARRRHGILMAPPSPPHLLRQCSNDIFVTFDAMAFQIMQKSELRPPPLPPPRRGPKPMIMRL
jgi:hypothetical protein